MLDQRQYVHNHIGASQLSTVKHFDPNLAIPNSMLRMTLPA